MGFFNLSFSQIDEATILFNFSICGFNSSSPGPGFSNKISQITYLYSFGCWFRIENNFASFTLSVITRWAPCMVESGGPYSSSGASAGSLETSINTTFFNQGFSSDLKILCFTMAADFRKSTSSILMNEVYCSNIVNMSKSAAWRNTKNSFDLYSRICVSSLNSVIKPGGQLTTKFFNILQILSEQ